MAAMTDQRTLGRNSRVMPNSTQIPNFVIDRLMPTVSNACLAVVIFVCRKTFGWGKAEDRISLTQIEKGTGLSRPWTVKTLAKLTVCGLLLKKRSPKGDIYQLNLNCDLEAVLNTLRSTELTSEASSPVLVNSVCKTGELSSHTKPTKTKPTIKTNTAAKSASALNESSFQDRSQPLDDSDCGIAICIALSFSGVKLPREVAEAVPIIRGALGFNNNWQVFDFLPAKWRCYEQTSPKIRMGFERWLSTAQWKDGEKPRVNGQPVRPKWAHEITEEQLAAND
jgi:hypothetical protein